jgi:hypothetical protein
MSATTTVVKKELPVLEPFRGGLREVAKGDPKGMLSRKVDAAKALPNLSLGKPAGKKGGGGKRKAPKGRKEKSLGSHVKRGLEHGARFAWDWLWRRAFGSAGLRKVANLQKQLVLAKRSDYLSVKSDGKDVKVEKSDTTKLLENDLGAVRELLGRSFGHQSVKITLTVPFTLASTVTTGVVNTVVSIRPSFSGEFTSLAALFEEYKCMGGTVHFTNYLRSAYLIGSAAATLNSAMLAVCFDTTNAVLTSVSSATEYEQHLCVLNGAQAGSPLVDLRAPHQFHFRIPSGIELGGTAYNSSTWVPTTVTAADFGYLKSYSVGTEVVALDTVIGYTRLHCEFRMRE